MKKKRIKTIYLWDLLNIEVILNINYSLISIIIFIILFNNNNNINNNNNNKK